MRKIAISLFGVLLLAAAFLVSPSLRAGAANVLCSLEQGGAQFTAASGCTISLAAGSEISGAGSVYITGNMAIPNGAAPAATCTAGELFLDTNEGTDTNCTTTADNSLCLCVATDTWVQLNNN